MKIAALTLAWVLSETFAIAACEGVEQAPAAADGVEWGYDGPGAPENWTLLFDEYAPWADGKQQSPVDITGYQTGDAGRSRFRTAATRKPCATTAGW